MLLLLACEISDPKSAPTDESNDSTQTEDGLLDLTQEFPEDSPGQAVLRTPIFEVPPFTEVMYCTVGTWTEPSAGVVDYSFTQALPYGHHAQLLYTQTPASEIPDGSLIDCTNGGIAASPLFQGARTGNQMLPDGMALWMPQGLRWVVQSHYINTTAQTLRVNDAVFLSYVAEEEVENWASSWNFGDAELDIPEGESSVKFDCAWPLDYNLLSISPHMHEYGTSIVVEWEHEGEITELYRMDPWQASYRDDPPVTGYSVDNVQPKLGDTFAVTCNYNNTSGAPLIFPEEMCGIYGLGYSSKDPVNCSIGQGEPMH